MRLLLSCVVLLALAAPAFGSTEGYYRYPAIHGDTVVFVSEGDLWKVPVTGGTAVRLTTHPGYESMPALSPDGTTVAFTAQYEGPLEVYVMPVAGGLPTRLTWDGTWVRVLSVAPDGRVLISTRAYGGLQDYQLVWVDPGTGAAERVPLDKGWEGVVTPDGGTLVFVRKRTQSSHTKRYLGGLAQDVWRWTMGSNEEPVRLTDFEGIDCSPMTDGERIFFVSERDGTRNLWSMDLDGGDVRQLTTHVGIDVAEPDYADGRIVYQHGADLRLYTLADGSDVKIPVVLDSDFDQTRERWVTDPMGDVTSWFPLADGSGAVLVSRGRLFVAPLQAGRIRQLTRDAGIRVRTAISLPESERVVAITDEAGELELWSFPDDGVGERVQLTDDAAVRRLGMVASPDGKTIAHWDKERNLYLFTVDGGVNRKVDTARFDDFADLAWSPDSRWLAYAVVAENQNPQIRVLEAASGDVHTVTSDRYRSYAPAWSPDGDFLWFLSERNLRSLVRGVWGPRQPEPLYDRTTEILGLALRDGLVSPFAPDNELRVEPADDKDDDEEELRIDIAFDGLEARLVTVPVDAGNYRGLFALGDRLYWMDSPDLHSDDINLMSVAETRFDPEVDTVVEKITWAEPSADGSRILVRKGKALHLVEPGGSAKLEAKNQVALDGWAYSFVPRDEWRQMFVDAWRMHRDHFYDPGMHGVDWPAMRTRYEPMVERVRDREEFADLVAQMVSELTAMHTYVYGGDHRSGPDDIDVATFGARFSRARDGWKVEHVYVHDPDEPELAAPFSRPGVDVEAGDVVLAIDGVDAGEYVHPNAAIRHKAGQQVRLRVRDTGGDERDVIVEPVSSGTDAELRYREWEVTRRLEVEEEGEGEIGYVHLRAMGGDDIDRFVRDYYPVYTRKGLIVDVRHNGGGNIESWILSRLSRQAWMYWNDRFGDANERNMQFAFLGHMVLIMDERTVSDGEVFAEGFKRLGLGPALGTRTWGGEIWLTSSNNMVDRGIATAAEFGVYGPEGDWLIENYGVEPDIEVEQPPHATFQGGDAQLEAALEYLKRKIAEEPPVWPAPPAFPDKSSEDNGKR